MIFILLIFSSPVFSTVINSEKFIVLLDEQNNAYINSTVKYIDITTTNISYLFLGPITNLNVYWLDNNTFKPLDCKPLKKTVGYEITCPKPKQERLEIIFTFNTTGFIKYITESSYEFNFNKGITTPMNEFILKVYLPEKSVISKTTNLQPVSPPPTKIDIDSTGRRVIVIWNISKPSLGKRYSFDVLFEQSTIPFAQNTQERTKYFYMGVILTLIIIIIYLLRSKRNIKQRFIEVLVEDEKKVLDAIQMLGDGCKQKEVVKATGFSKAKVSKIIDDLQKRNIVYVERKGRENRLYLK